MTDDSPPAKAGPQAPDEDQASYARWLARGTALGLAIVAVSFVVYVFRLVPPHVAYAELPRLWSLPLAEFLRETGSPTGWDWARMLDRSDTLAILGIAVLAGASVPALIAVIPVYARRRLPALLWICVLQVVVLVLAASNLISGGH